MRFTRIISFSVAAILLLAAADKLMHYEGFVNALRNYALVPRGTAPYLALPVILAEAAIGVGLLFRRTQQPSGLAAALLFATFTLAVAFNYMFGARGICGCWFTITLAKGTGTHIVQNVILILLSLSVWWDSRMGRTQLSRPPLTDMQPVTSAGGG